MMESQISINSRLAELCRLLRNDIPDKLKHTLAGAGGPNGACLRIEASLCSAHDSTEPMQECPHAVDRILLVSAKFRVISM